MAFLIPFVPGISEDAPIKKIILLAVQGAGYSVFPSVLREGYLECRAANPDVKQRNGLADHSRAITAARR